DRYSDLVAPAHKLLELVGAGLVTRHELLSRSVGACPPAIPVREHGNMARQSVAVELGDQPMLICGVQQARRVQSIHELPQPIETCHNWQRIPLRRGFCVAFTTTGGDDRDRQLGYCSVTWLTRVVATGGGSH